MEYFKGIEKALYKGKDSKDDFSFKHYNASETIGNKTMEEWMPFAMSWWHTLTSGGSDPFGNGSYIRPWSDKEPLEASKMRVEAGFELMQKLGINYFCFHDRDLAPECKSLKETNQKLDIIVGLLEENMSKTNKKVLWATSSLFTNPRYMRSGY